MIRRIICTILIATYWTHAAANERIVAIGPEIVEIAFALGVGDRIIAVDKHSTYPPETNGKNSLGYFRALSAEGIFSTKPDLVIVTPDAGPPETIEILKGSDLDVRVAPDANTPTDVPQLIKFIGNVISKEEEAQSLIEDYQSNLGLSDQLKVND
ncbi:MAG: ABC transporter substrate-binding protein, partial [Pseudomonadota bacterium]